MKYFNTAGPCVPELHYTLPPEPRLPEARELVEQGQYFVVHAPRQTGKTTTLAALARTLTSEGRHAAMRFSCESGEVAGDDYAAAQRAVLEAIATTAQTELPAELQPPQPWPDASPELRLLVGLRAWAAQCPRPLVLFFDEIDALRGEGLRSVLRQLRDGYTRRPAPFPYSVALCGLRDVRDFGDACEPERGLDRAAAGGDPSRLGTSSPFNIKIESLRLGDFSMRDVRELYGQRTAETGQPFTDEAIRSAYQHTQGQPWLVNALANEIIGKMHVAPPNPITAEHVDEAKERLILARATHLDSLLARLTEPRVRRIIEPLIAGELAAADATYDDDLAYVRDLGLVAPGRPIAIANPIYREVIVRVLGARTEDAVAADRAVGQLRVPSRAIREFVTDHLGGPALAVDQQSAKASSRPPARTWLRHVEDGHELDQLKRIDPLSTCLDLGDHGPVEPDCLGQHGLGQAGPRHRGDCDLRLADGRTRPVVEPPVILSG